MKLLLRVKKMTIDTILNDGSNTVYLTGIPSVELRKLAENDDLSQQVLRDLRTANNKLHSELYDAFTGFFVQTKNESFIPSIEKNIKLGERMWEESFFTDELKAAFREFQTSFSVIKEEYAANKTSLEIFEKLRRLQTNFFASVLIELNDGIYSLNRSLKEDDRVAKMPSFRATRHDFFGETLNSIELYSGINSLSEQIDLIRCAFEDCKKYTEIRLNNSLCSHELFFRLLGDKIKCGRFSHTNNMSEFPIEAVCFLTSTCANSTKLDEYWSSTHMKMVEFVNANYGDFVVGKDDLTYFRRLRLGTIIQGEDETPYFFDFKNWRGDVLSAAINFEVNGRRKAAIKLYKVAMNRCIDSKDYMLASRISEHIGDFSSSAGILERIGEFKKAAKSANKMGDHLKARDLFCKAGDLKNLARTFEQIGDSENASKTYEDLGEYLLAAEKVKSRSEKKRLYLKCKETALKNNEIKKAIKSMLKLDEPDKALELAIQNKLYYVVHNISCQEKYGFVSVKNKDKFTEYLGAAKRFIKKVNDLSAEQKYEESVKLLLEAKEYAAAIRILRDQKDYEGLIKLYLNHEELGEKRRYAEVAMVYYLEKAKSSQSPQKDYEKAIDYFIKAGWIGNAASICIDELNNTDRALQLALEHDKPNLAANIIEKQDPKLAIKLRLGIYNKNSFSKV